VRIVGASVAVNVRLFKLANWELARDNGISPNDVIVRLVVYELKNDVVDVKDSPSFVPLSVYVKIISTLTKLPVKCVIVCDVYFKLLLVLIIGMFAMICVSVAFPMLLNVYVNVGIGGGGVGTGSTYSGKVG
jgi:hypothetical protein